MLLKHLASISVMAGLVALALPASPAQAVSRGDYEGCATTLLGLKISSEETESACARAFKPQDLATCVSRINQDSKIVAADALRACRQVRRPVDMASCVVDIHTSLSMATSADVLDNCRRSLLPDRYSNCVLGLSKGIDKLPAGQAMTTCISASDFPAELDPTFIPYPLPSQSVVPSVPGPAMPTPVK